MGVSGLAPFLQRFFPDVFQTFPKRFQGLSGKRVVIDGTLLTQRLHFAPMPHKYRHVLGWYRVISELQESNVTTFCVFDGKERSIAKQTEIERRRHTRRIETVRGLFEVDRLRRLRKLSSLLGSWQVLTTEEQSDAAGSIHQLFSPSNGDLNDQASPLPLYLAGNVDLPPQDQTRVKTLTALAERAAYGDFDETDVDDILLRRTGVPVSASQDLHAEPFPHQDEGSTSPITIHDAISSDFDTTPIDTVAITDMVSLDDAQTKLDESCEIIDEVLADGLIPNIGWSHVGAAHVPSHELITAISSLFNDYRQSLPQLENISTQPPSTLQTSAETDAEVMKEEYLLSKSQNQLTLEEGRFWEQFLSQPCDDVLQMQMTVTSLSQKSSIITESYERRTNPPTSTTYEECKEIIAAMGIPCIETDGPYEAEALASSFVVHGYADFVASEDTDVLVYEAPLLRNVSNRKDPLVLISGSDVRKALDLSPEAYVDFVLLLGTDFSQRIKNVGPQRALKFIREYGNIENIVGTETSYPPRIPIDVYLKQVALAREVFTTLPSPPEDASILLPREKDDEKVFEIMKKYGLQFHVNQWEPRNALAGNYFQDNPAAW
ncbi:XPG/Rad2 endonuclease [Abortiporus biennis]